MNVRGGFVDLRMCLRGFLALRLSEVLLGASFCVQYCTVSSNGNLV